MTMSFFFFSAFCLLSLLSAWPSWVSSSARFDSISDSSQSINAISVPSGASSIKWLALSQWSSDELRNKPARKMCSQFKDNLIRKQVSFCRRNPSFMDSVRTGAIQAIQECQFQFQDRRWNCSTVADTLSSHLERVMKPLGRILHKQKSPSSSAALLKSGGSGSGGLSTAMAASKRFMLNQTRRGRNVEREPPTATMAGRTRALRRVNRRRVFPSSNRNRIQLARRALLGRRDSENLRRGLSSSASFHGQNAVNRRRINKLRLRSQRQRRMMMPTETKQAANLMSSRGRNKREAIGFESSNHVADVVDLSAQYRRHRRYNGNSNSVRRHLARHSRPGLATRRQARNTPFSYNTTSVRSHHDVGRSLIKRRLSSSVAVAPVHHISGGGLNQTLVLQSSVVQRQPAFERQNPTINIVSYRHVDNNKKSKKGLGGSDLGSSKSSFSAGNSFESDMSGAAAAVATSLASAQLNKGHRLFKNSHYYAKLSQSQQKKHQKLAWTADPEEPTEPQMKLLKAELLARYYPIVSSGTREMAFVHAVSSAGVAHALTRACSSGELDNCGCDRSLRGTSPDGFEWSGCSDNIDFGITFSRAFVDARDRRRSRRSTTSASQAQSLMNLHNNEAGRKILEQNMKIECKCHGVSGSCELKTCWRRVASFRVIGEMLKEKFDNAHEVEQRRRRGRRMLMPATEFKPNSIAISTGAGPELLGGHQHHQQQKIVNKVSIARSGARPRLSQKHTATDLVYLRSSPDYCEYDIRRGSLGTHGRECNPNSDGPDSCGALCCDRGYRTRTEKRVERCKCKFHWCCFVQCEECHTTVTVSTCN